MDDGVECVGWQVYAVVERVMWEACGRSMPGLKESGRRHVAGLRQG